MNPTPPPVYAEDGCARRWPLLLWGLWLPAALEIIAILLGALVHPYWFIAVPLIPLLAPFLIAGSLLYRNWPTGIRLDGDGLRIGAVASIRAARRTRPLNVARQNWGVFSAPWDTIATMRVVTDRDELRRLRTDARYFTLSNRWGKPRGLNTNRCRLGALTAPFMRAALVVELDPAGAELPTTRAARLYPNQIGRPFRTRIQADPGPVWIAPTRHPSALAEAVDQFPAGRPFG